MKWWGLYPFELIQALPMSVGQLKYNTCGLAWGGGGGEVCGWCAE